ncbi:MAG TPA: hypothetical protein VNH41_03640 [Steroidobacteraceae bacterium]|nr:hypothetical protein [Steroidobacteraceae bacterium]
MEELRIGIAAELMTQHAEGSGGVAEGASDLVGGAVFDEEGAKRFVLALTGMGGLGEESSDICYVFRYAYTHTCIVLYREQRRQRQSHRYPSNIDELKLHAAWRGLEGLAQAMQKCQRPRAGAVEMMG